MAEDAERDEAVHEKQARVWCGRVRSFPACFRMLLEFRQAACWGWGTALGIHVPLSSTVQHGSTELETLSKSYHFVVDLCISRLDGQSHTLTLALTHHVCMCDLICNG